MKIRILFCLSLFILLYSQNSHAQNIAINEDGTPADSTAILDIKSSSKGLLIPRLSSFQRNDILEPANGLLVFDLDSRSFWYSDEGIWKELDSQPFPQTLFINGDELGISQGNTVTLSDDQQLSIVNHELILENGGSIILDPYLDNTDAQQLSINNNEISISNGNTISLPAAPLNTELQDTDGDTRVTVENTSDSDDVLIYLGGQTLPTFAFNSGGLEIFTGENLNIGEDAGSALASANFNLNIGKRAGSANNDGNYNTYIGYEAGEQATGSSNTVVGTQSGLNMTDASSNTIVGDYSGNSITTGGGNVLLGAASGNSLTGGSGNIFIGTNSGSSETGNNKLFIDNSSSSTPLLYGEFDNNLLRINGELNIENQYSFPSVDGSTGQVISTDGNGNLNWVDISVASTDNIFTREQNVVSNSGGSLSLDDFVFGSSSLDEDGNADHRKRMIFDKSRGAFRAGEVSGTEWDESVRGFFSFAAGSSNQVSGESSGALGFQNDVAGSYSNAFGFRLNVDGIYSTAVGRYNIGGGQNFTPAENDPVFEVGIGTSNSNRLNALTVLRNGKTLIGELTESQLILGDDYKLVVDGGLLCENIKVQDSGNWPDFVFEDEYDLMELSSLRNFIDEHHHLPDVPSASEMNGNGIDLGSMNELLLRKLEELTLYVLELEEEVNELKAAK